MQQIEQFNRLLNLDQLDRFSKWSSFRHVIDQELQSAECYVKEHELAVVLGAGRCDDFTLENLISKFQYVILADVDINSIYESTQYQQLIETERQRVEVRQVEFTGMENSGLFQYLETKAVLVSSYDEIDKAIEEMFRTTLNYQFLKDCTKRCDLVYVSAIYTQLIVQQVLVSCNKLRKIGLQEQFVNYIQESIFEKMNQVYQTFNGNIKRISKGKIVVSSDILQDSPKSKFIQALKKEFNQEKIEAYYQSYFKEFGYGMGDLGLYYLDHLFTKQKEQWLLWPFSNETEMLVKLVTYTNYDDFERSST